MDLLSNRVNVKDQNPKPKSAELEKAGIPRALHKTEWQKDFNGESPYYKGFYMESFWHLDFGICHSCLALFIAPDFRLLSLKFVI